MPRRPQSPIVLTIAGFDPSSGAGVSADLQTLAAHGCYGIACVTALTVQSTAGVKSVHPVPAAVIRKTLAELAADMPITAVKIGMLGSADVVGAVASFLRRERLRHVVLDPVLKSSSGARLLAPTAIGRFKRELLPLASVVTPNLDEAMLLTGLRVRDIADMRRAARRLHELGVPAVIVTGGHLPEVVDVVSASEWQRREPCIDVVEITGRRIHSRSTHGTGCAYSSSIAANLALGYDLAEAARRAREYVARAIATARPIGRGNGPLALLWPMK